MNGDDLIRMLMMGALNGGDKRKTNHPHMQVCLDTRGINFEPPDIDESHVLLTGLSDEVYLDFAKSAAAIGVLAMNAIVLRDTDFAGAVIGIMQTLIEGVNNGTISSRLLLKKMEDDKPDLIDAANGAVFKWFEDANPDLSGTPGYPKTERPDPKTPMGDNQVEFEAKLKSEGRLVTPDQLFGNMFGAENKAEPEQDDSDQGESDSGEGDSSGGDDPKLPDSFEDFFKNH